MVRARITTAATTTATEIQRMGARRTRCMTFVLVLRVGNPAGSPFHPLYGRLARLVRRSGLPFRGASGQRRGRGRIVVVGSLVVLPDPLLAAAEIDLELAPDGVADATLQSAHRTQGSRVEITCPCRTQLEDSPLSVQLAT